MSGRGSAEGIGCETSAAGCHPCHVSMPLQPCLHPAHRLLSPCPARTLAQAQLANRKYCGSTSQFSRLSGVSGMDALYR